MKIRILGFSLETGKGFQIEDFLDHLENLEDEIQHGDYGRLVFLDRTKTLVLGLLLTIKDQKAFYEIYRDEDEIEVRRHELEEGSSLMEFNYFIINPANCTGLYQTYHNACGINPFGSFLKKRYTEMKETKINELISALPEEQQTDAKLRRIKQKHARGLSFSILVRQENFKSLLEELSEIKTFEFDLTSLYDQDSAFRPLKKHSKKMSHRVIFRRGIGKDDIISALMKPINLDGIGRVRVKGETSDGLDRTIYLAENPDIFEELDFDDVASSLTIDLENLRNNPVSKLLVSLANEYLEISEQPPFILPDFCSRTRPFNLTGDCDRWPFARTIPPTMAASLTA